MNQKIQKNQIGFSLMEVLVSLFVIMVLMIGVYGLIILSLQITADNKYYVEAIALADQRMEQIRNLPYADVGVQGGSPNGDIPQVEIVNYGGNYTINTYITFHDDPYDGKADSTTTPDTIFNDYKIATVKVAWSSKFGPKNVTLFSKIIPRTVETFAGYGLLKIYVGNASAQPVSSANVRVVNNALVPAVDVTNLTDSEGILYLPVLASVQAYEITVTKTDQEYLGIYYGTDQTYNPATSKSPFHMSISAGDMNYESFVIDRLADLRIRTVSAGLPENWQVNGASAGAEIYPRLGADASGNLYFAWQSQNGLNSSVYAQKYNSAQARQWASDVLISTTPYQTNPDIAVTDSGSSFIVWQDNSRSLKAITYGRNGQRYALETFKKDSLNLDSPTFIISPPAIARDLFWADLTNSASRSWLGSTAAGALTDPIYFRLGGLPFFAKKFFVDNFKINSAQAAGAIVQTKIGAVVNSSNTLTTTFDSTPASGNVIIAIAMHRNTSTAFSAPTNTAGTFTVSVYSNSSWALDVGIWHKVAGASEPKTVTITNSGNISGGVMMLMEVSGLDTSSLTDVVVSNDQTGASSNTATTNSTAVSRATGFAVAAIGWADDDFSTPTSASWSSVSPDSWTHRLWEDWTSGNDGSLGVATLNVNSAAAQRATLTTTGGGTEERNSVLAVYRIFVPDNITVSAAGTQISSTTIPTANVYIGGAFVLTDNTGTRNVTSIIITEDGTVDAQNDLGNIKLFYDLDTSAPYDCASESYSGGEAQFGSTDLDGFSGADGTSVFTGSVNISTVKTLCLYAVLDIKAGAEKDETLDIKINNPTSDVVISSGSVLPATAVVLSGTTNLLTPAEMQQIHYRWRNDDGTEIGATWKEDEDAPASITVGTAVRLRFAVTNGGSYASDPVQYRLEYGENTTGCASVAAWAALPFNDSLDWRINDSTYVADGDPTIDNPDIYSENLFFKQGEIKDAGNQTAAISLVGSEFTEIEYVIKATANSGSVPYCFRLTDAGIAGDFNYLVYPEISVIGDDNIYLASLDANGNERWSIKRVNEDIAGEAQENPRIAVTENFGSATTTIIWVDGRNGNDDIYAQIFDNAGNKILTAGDLRLTSSTTDEYSPGIAFDSNDNFFVVWVDDDPTSDKIYLQKYRLNDQAGWPAAKNIVASPYDVYSPAIAIDSSDNLYLVYTELVLGIQNVYLAKYDSDGNLIWEHQANLESLASNQFSPSLVIAGSYVFASWTDMRDDNGDIYVQKFDLDGNAIWAQDLRLNIETSSSTQNNSVLSINSSGDAFAAWQDMRGGDYNIFATEFHDPGALTGVAGVPIHVWSTKTISETPVIYKYDRIAVSGAGGNVDLSVEHDAIGYRCELVSASTSLSIILKDPVEPLKILPAESLTWLIYVE